MREAKGKKREAHSPPEPPGDFNPALGCYGPSRTREQCGGAVVSRGLCKGHLEQWSLDGKLGLLSHPVPDPPKNFDASLGCYGPGRDGKRCGGKVLQKGVCSTHYNQWRWNGELSPPRLKSEARSHKGFLAHGIHWPTKALFEEVKRAAKAAGKSPNAFIVQSVKTALGHPEED